MIEAIVASAATVWVILAVVLVMLFIASASDSFGLAFWVTVLGFVAFQFATQLDPWGLIKENPRTAGLLAALYFPVGIGWSFYRWWRLLANTVATLRETKATWSPSGFSRDLSWEAYVNNTMPNASQNKSRICYWIVYWPFSVLAYLLVDFLYEIGNWIYTQISGLYQRMSDHFKKSLLGE